MSVNVPDSGSKRDVFRATDGPAPEDRVKASALQSAIFNSANFSCIATDALGVIQIFNVGAERMLGYTSAEVVNKITPADFSDPLELIARARELSLERGAPVAPGFQTLVFRASRGIEDIYELTYTRRDGTRFPAVVSVTALRDAQEAIIGYLLIGTDHTARKKVEDERVRLELALQEQNVELQSAKLIAEQANRSKSDFLSSMSHELRSPLNAILGFAQLLETESPPPSPGQMESIGRILQAGWHLLTLINEVLDLAKIESGTFALSPEPVALDEIMSECQAMTEGQAQKRGLQLSFPEFTSPCFVHADRTRLKQVLINLLSNAIKYNREQGTVTVQYRRTPLGRIRVSVADTGEGLPPEKLGQLFQPFNRLGQEASGEEGTGIGLVVARQLIRLMGGIIGVESTVGVGSVFWFELSVGVKPLAAAEDSPGERPGPPAGETGARKRVVLYVEDNPANLSLVQQLISRHPDLRLLTAGTGRLGVELARAELPDVVLMDINLPDISGIEALRQLLQDPATAHIPVVAVSANAMPYDIEHGLKAGFFRYLTKPIRIHEFNETLSIALAFAEAGRAGARTGGTPS